MHWLLDVNPWHFYNTTNINSPSINKWWWQTYMKVPLTQQHILGAWNWRSLSIHVHLTNQQLDIIRIEYKKAYKNLFNSWNSSINMWRLIQQSMSVTFSSSLVSSPKCFNKLDNSDLFVTLEFGYDFGKIKRLMKVRKV